MNPAPEAKIRMFKSSSNCLVCGLLGLLPVIGLPFAIAALVIAGKVRAQERNLWNAARPYRIGGVVSAAVGTIFWSFILILVIFHAIYDRGVGDC
jgi:hypothetical protein